MIALTKYFSEESVEETSIINMVSFICMSLSCICENIAIGWIGFGFASITLLFNLIGVFLSNRISQGKDRIRIFRRRINQLIFSICYIIIFLFAFVNPQDLAN